MNTKTINIQVLALLGDAVLSLYIREKLLKQGINNANKLNASAVPYVSAKGQVKILDKLTKDNFLTEEELDIVKRGRYAGETQSWRTINKLVPFFKDYTRLTNMRQEADIYKHFNEDSEMFISLSWVLNPDEGK